MGSGEEKTYKFEWRLYNFSKIVEKGRETKQIEKTFEIVYEKVVMPW